MQEKIWLQAYPKGVPHEITLDEYQCLSDLIETSCQRFADRPAFGNFGTFMNFRQVNSHSHAFAAWLQHQGVRAGETRVALMMPNMLAYPVALFGVLHAGATVVNVNPQYTASELTHQLKDSGAQYLLAYEQALPTIAEISDDFPDLKIIVTRIGDFMPWPKAVLFNRIARRRNPGNDHALKHCDTLLDIIERGSTLTLEKPNIGPNDLAFLQYTGGTTGRSKGAMLTQRNILSNIAQVNAWFAPLTTPGEEIVITALPLYHIYALTGNCLAFLRQGGMNYLITDPRNLKTFVKELKRVRFTAITGVNTLFNALLHQEQFASVDFSALKFTSGGGMAVQRAVAEQWQQVTGSPIAEGYGLTEASPVVTANRFDTDGFTGCIGLPVPSTDIRIVADDGSIQGIGEPGELCVRGPQVMRGYWRNPEATAEVLDDDGWLRTGDIAVMHDDGNLRIVDRKKDLIVVSGFNVYPNEIEDVVVRHPDVLEAAAIGVRDEKSGEAVRLVVVCKADSTSAEDIIAWCREYLTGYKIPRSVIFTDALPKSNVGKILRREVREQFGSQATKTGSG